MFGHPLERDLASLVAWAPRDVLVVAAGYRLGALGFKTGDGGEGDAGAELNLGLRAPEGRRGLGGEINGPGRLAAGET